MAFAEIVAWASLRRRPARTAFSVLGVAVGIAVVVAIAIVDRTTLLHARPDRAQGWRADLEVRPGPGLGDPAAALAAMAGVARFTEVLQGEAELQGTTEDASPRGARAPVRLVGLEPAAFEMGLFSLTAGEGLTAPAGDDTAWARQVLLGAPIAALLDAAPGDLVLLSPPGRAVRRDCIDGQVVERRPTGPPPPASLYRVAGVLAADGAGRIADGRLVVLHVGAARTLLAGHFQPPSFWLARDERVAPEDLQARLVTDFAVDLRRGSIVGQQADERAFRNGVRLAGLLSLALGLYVIFHTLSMGLVERAREMATLEALGASRRQIGRAVFAEALVIAALAGGVGLGLGMALARVMLHFGISSLGITDSVSDKFEVPWEEVGPLVIAGVAIALAGSVSPLLRWRRSETVPLLRGDETGPKHRTARPLDVVLFLLVVGALPAVYFLAVPLVGEFEAELVGLVLMALGVLGLLVGTPLLVPGPVGAAARVLAEPLRRWSPFSGLLAARSISLSPTRIAACTASVALVTAAFVGLRGMTTSLAQENETWVEEGVARKLWVHGMGNVPWRPIADALRAEGVVSAVEPLDTRLTAPFRVVGLPPSEMAYAGPLARDPNLARAFVSRPSLIVTRRLASQQGLRPGDQVGMATPSSGVVLFEVLAIDDSHGYLNRPHERAYAVTSAQHLKQFFCVESEGADNLALRLAPGVDGATGAEAYGRVAAALGLDTSRTGFSLAEDIAAYEHADIVRDFRVFDVILALALALAGVGVLNGLLLAAMERSKELGVLRALGADGGQIARSVLLESLFIGVAGGVIGLAIGLALVPVVVAALRVLSGLELPQPGWQPVYLAGPVLAIAIALLGGLYPLWRMGRTDPVRAVRGG